MAGLEVNMAEDNEERRGIRTTSGLKRDTHKEIKMKDERPERS
jgi:hypothetical protein